MSEIQIHAWKQEPAPDGTLLYESDLEKPKDVLDLFLQVKMSEGYITPAGWQHLFEFHGVQNLYDYDKSAEWFDVKNKEEWVSSFFMQAFSAGFDPTTGDFGDYDLETTTFISLEGLSRQIDWKHIKTLANHLK